MTELWDEICEATRYGVEDPKLLPLPLRRAGEQPGAHRSPAREQRHPHRAGSAGRHALEARRSGPGAPAAGVERGPGSAATRGISSGPCASSRSSPTRRTCSSLRRPLRRLRGSSSARHGRSRRPPSAELDKVLGMGGAVAAVENAYMKQRLVESQTRRAYAGHRVRRADRGRASTALPRRSRITAHRPEARADRS